MRLTDVIGCSPPTREGLAYYTPPTATTSSSSSSEASSNYSSNSPSASFPSPAASSAGPHGSYAAELAAFAAAPLHSFPCSAPRHAGATTVTLPALLCRPLVAVPAGASVLLLCATTLDTLAVLPGRSGHQIVSLAFSPLTPLPPPQTMADTAAAATATKPEAADNAAPQQQTHDVLLYAGESGVDAGVLVFSLSLLGPAVALYAMRPPSPQSFVAAAAAAAARVALSQRASSSNSSTTTASATPAGATLAGAVAAAVTAVAHLVGDAEAESAAESVAVAVLQPATVGTVAPSPCGRWLLAASNTGTALWALATPTTTSTANAGLSTVMESSSSGASVSANDVDAGAVAVAGDMVTVSSAVASMIHYNNNIALSQPHHQQRINSEHCESERACKRERKRRQRQRRRQQRQRLRQLVWDWASASVLTLTRHPTLPDADTTLALAAAAAPAAAEAVAAYLSSPGDYAVRSVNTGANTDADGSAPCLLLASAAAGVVAVAARPPPPLALAWSQCGSYYAHSHLTGGASVVSVAEVSPRALLLASAVHGDTEGKSTAACQSDDDVLVAVPVAVELLTSLSTLWQKANPYAPGCSQSPLELQKTLTEAITRAAALTSADNDNKNRSKSKGAKRQDGDDDENESGTVLSASLLLTLSHPNPANPMPLLHPGTNRAKAQSDSGSARASASACARTYDEVSLSLLLSLLPALLLPLTTSYSNDRNISGCGSGGLAVTVSTPVRLGLHKNILIPSIAWLPTANAHSPSNTATDVNNTNASACASGKELWAGPECYFLTATGVILLLRPKLFPPLHTIIAASSSPSSITRSATAPATATDADTARAAAAAFARVFAADQADVLLPTMATGFAAAFNSTVRHCSHSLRNTRII